MENPPNTPLDALPTRTNLVTPILLSVLTIALIFGFGGYFLGKQPSVLSQKTQSQLDSTTITDPTDIREDKQIYVDPDQKFSFSYPRNLKPLELSNGVVTFLPIEFYDACQSAQGSENMKAFEPCHKAVFLFGGLDFVSAESYQTYTRDIKDIAGLQSYTDEKNRVWQTVLVLGEVYNFDAFTTIDGKDIRVSFQYDFNAPQTEEVSAFFNQILATFELSEAYLPFPVVRKKTKTNYANWALYEDKSGYRFYYPKHWFVSQDGGQVQNWDPNNLNSIPRPLVGEETKWDLSFSEEPLYSLEESLAQADSIIDNWDILEVSSTTGGWPIYFAFKEAVEPKESFGPVGNPYLVAVIKVSENKTITLRGFSGAPQNSTNIEILKQIAESFQKIPLTP